MLRLTDFGRQTVEALSSQYMVSVDAVETLAAAMANTGGSMAQFSHPDLGGSGQWMQGGMTMVGDMFNSGLSMTVNNICTGISMAMQQGQLFQPPQPHEFGGKWWPDELGTPTSSGGQNNMRYGVFPNARRIALDQGGTITIFDSGDHMVGGVSQQQDGGGTRLTFSSQFGEFGLFDLPIVQGGQGGQNGQGAQNMGNPAPMQNTNGSPQLVSPQPSFQRQQSNQQQQNNMQSSFAPPPNMPPLQPEMPPMNAAPGGQAFQNDGLPPQNMHQRTEGDAQFASSSMSSSGTSSSASSSISSAAGMAPPAAAEEGDALAALERLASLVEKGLLTREEFDAKKVDLLSRI